MPEEKTEETHSEEEDTVERNESTMTSEERKDAFDLGEGTDDTNEIMQSIEKLGGDEGVEMDKGELQDVDPDTPLDDLARGATSDSEQEISPPEAESDDSEPEQSEPESEEAQTEEEVTADIDRETLEFVQENREKVENLQEWQKELTQRSQALSDVETLAEVRQFMAQDPGRAEAFAEFVEEAQEGKYDADRDIELDTPDIPEQVKGTEYEEVFESILEQNQQLAEQLNRQRKILNQQKTQQTAGELVGQDQGAVATGDDIPDEVLEEEMKRYESFIESHPELVDENGEPTEQLQQIQTVAGNMPPEIDKPWERAYSAVADEEVIGSGNQSEQKEEKPKGESRTATPTSELTNETDASQSDQGEQTRYDQLVSSEGSIGQLRNALDEVQ